LFRLSTERLSPEEREETKLPLYASRLFEYGSQGRGYWDAEDVVRHTLDIAITMFERDP